MASDHFSRKPVKIFLISHLITEICCKSYRFDPWISNNKCKEKRPIVCTPKMQVLCSKIDGFLWNAWGIWRKSCFLLNWAILIWTDVISTTRLNGLLFYFKEIKIIDLGVAFQKHGLFRSFVPDITFEIQINSSLCIHVL